MALSDKLKSNINLFKEYCSTFEMKPITNAEVLERWEEARGPMLAAAFLGGNTDEAPVAWVAPDPDGELYIEQDEDLLGADEPAVAAMSENLVRVAISAKQPIHAIV